MNSEKNIMYISTTVRDYLLKEVTADIKKPHFNNCVEVLEQFDEGETHQTMSNKSSGWALFNSFTYPIFNPEQKRLAKSKTKDAAEIAYKGMNGSVAEKVTKIFDKVFKVVA